MLTTLKNPSERWITGVHCLITETHTVDYERKTRGPSTYTAYVGTAASHQDIPGKFSTLESMESAIRAFIADHNIVPTLASRSGRVGAARTLKLSPDDIDLLHQILARERVRRT